MFKKLYNFYINGWGILGIAVVVVACVSISNSASTKAQQQAANIASSLPTKEIKKFDGTTPPKEPSEIRSDSSGAKSYGNTKFSLYVDEITGIRMWDLALSSPLVPGAIKMSRYSRGVGASFEFPSPLDFDLNESGRVSARFTLRDGTAVVREYRTLHLDSDPNNAIILAEEAVADLSLLLSKSAYVVARSYTISGRETFIRLEVDPVNWASTMVNGQLILMPGKTPKPTI